jgi:VWFA-related protein
MACQFILPAVPVRGFFTMRPIRLTVLAAIFPLCVATSFAAGQAPPSQPTPTAAAPAATSQNPAAGATPQATTPVIHANSNLVVLDVVVTDRGSAVHGIDRSRFHVAEDGKEQAISSFEEHQPPPISAQGYKPVALPPHTYSNAPVYPQASAFNVLLLDGLNTPLDKQGDVRHQMIEYMGKIAPGTTLAVFTLSSRLRMITGFTSDVSRLTKAVESEKATPRTSDVAGSEMAVSSDTDTTLDNMTGSLAAGDWGSMLTQWDADATAVQDTERVRLTLDAFQRLALYLGGIPGRKNIIWFSGSFPIGLDPDPTMRNGFDAARMYAKEIRETNEDLTAARVSVYPVDARGLMNNDTVDATYFAPGSIGSGASGGFGRSRTPGLSPVGSDTHASMETNAEEESTMRQIAKETGGKAYINTNGLKDAVADAVANGSSYYTITYAPENKNYNGAFRKLQVRVGGNGYNLAYRDGYYADPAEKIAANGATQLTPIIAAMLHGAPPATQILFNTRVLPASDPHFRDVKFSETPAGQDAAQLKGPLHRTVVDLLVDPRGLDFATAQDGTRLDNVEFVLVAYDSDGKRLNYVDRPLQLSLDAEHYAKVRASGFPVRMELDLPAGVFSLRIAVYDLNSGHIGSLEVPLQVAAK